MKSKPLLPALMILVALTGCSNNGTKLAKASEAFAECSLAGKSSCVAKLNDGTQLTSKSATLFANDDSVRVESVVQRADDCLGFGNEAGKTRNTSVTINDATVKMYGAEHEGAVKRACDGPAPYHLAVTVAKQS